MESKQAWWPPIYHFFYYILYDTICICDYTCYPIWKYWTNFFSRIARIGRDHRPIFYYYLDIYITTNYFVQVIFFASIVCKATRSVQLLKIQTEFSNNNNKMITIAITMFLNLLISFHLASIIQLFLRVQLLAVRHLATNLEAAHDSMSFWMQTIPNKNISTLYKFYQNK